MKHYHPNYNLILFASMVASACFGQATSFQSGTVTASETHAPIPNATVVATEHVGGVTERPAILLATTGSQGQFRLGLRAGVTYSICVHSVGYYLNSCRWGQGASATSQDPPLTLSLDRGIGLSVEIMDPGGLLPPSALSDSPGKGAPVGVQLINSSTGATRQIPFLRRGAHQFEYHDVVPAGGQWKLALNSSSIHLVDAKGSDYILGTEVALPSPPTHTPARVPAGGGAVSPDELVVIYRVVQ